MAATTLYFSGQLECKVEVSFGRLRGGGSGGGGGGPGGRGTGGLQGNGGNRGANLGGGLGYDAGPADVGVGTNGNGGMMGVGMGGRGGGQRSRGNSDDDGGPPAPSMGMAVAGPPATLYLRLTNRGQARIEVEVLDFNSEFGNFVVHPEQVVLEPGQWVEAEPMSSQILDTSGEVTVKVNLKSAGKKESQMIKLLPIPPS